MHTKEFQINHFRIIFSLFLKACLCAYPSYENEISFTCKLNSFSYEWLCTRPRFDREAQGNPERGYWMEAIYEKLVNVMQSRDVFFVYVDKSCVSSSGILLTSC